MDGQQRKSLKRRRPSCWSPSQGGGDRISGPRSRARAVRTAKVERRVSSEGLSTALTLFHVGSMIHRSRTVPSPEGGPSHEPRNRSVDR